MPLHSVTNKSESNIDGTTNAELMAEKQEQLTQSAMDQKFLDTITKAHDSLQQIKTRREALNAEKQEVIATLVDMGLDRNAVKSAMQYAETPVDKRQLFDLSYAATRKALGVPMQDDLFVAQAQRAVDAHQHSKGK